MKKHKNSRRPKSWRYQNKNITIDKSEAIEKLNRLIELLKEEQELLNFESLRATFEELARTESDCTLAKCGGDLGFFGLKKMQPAFEEASFLIAIDDTTNQILLTMLTTMMGTFSIFLKRLLFGILQASCNYCIALAIFLIVLAKLCWIGGAIPSKEQ